MPRVTGIVELPHAPEALATARLIVRVEWVGHADARARELGGFTLDAITPRQRRSGSVSFAIHAAEPQPGECVIRAHLDVDRSGAVSPGDYVTTEHIAVLTDRTAGPVRVTLTRVGSRPPG